MSILQETYDVVWCPPFNDYRIRHINYRPEGELLWEQRYTEAMSARFREALEIFNTERPYIIMGTFTGYALACSKKLGYPECPYMDFMRSRSAS